MKDILKKPIKSVDISYNNESNKISYNEYYFSGIPIPKDIKYEIKDNKLNLSWNIDKYIFKDLINTFHVQIKVNNKENTYTTLFNEYSLDNMILKVIILKIIYSDKFIMKKIIIKNVIIIFSVF